MTIIGVNITSSVDTSHCVNNISLIALTRNFVAAALTIIPYSTVVITIKSILIIRIALIMNDAAKKQFQRYLFQ